MIRPRGQREGSKAMRRTAGSRALGRAGIGLIAGGAMTLGTAESSSTWIGIGGGCMDANCLVSDSTLIQTGTEQDVDARGRGSYSAWWEVIPAPGIDIRMTFAPADRM